MSDHSILLVEDDTNLGNILSEYLELKGYGITLCTDGDTGYEHFKNNNYDLCVLDVMMPKKDGSSLARSIRTEKDQVPIIFLTAKSMKEDKIEGFTIGGDDYITKPFSIEEFLMRIQAVLKRCRPAVPAVSNNTASTYTIGGYNFDYRNQCLRFDDTDQHLTSREAELLKLLCEYRNEVLRREIALNHVWGDDSYFNGRSMDVYIAKLRKYLKKDPQVEIVTVHGTGFRLLAP